MHHASVRTSTPGMEAWRAHGDHLTYGEAGWLGCAWGIAMHATLHFFSVAIPALDALLVPFRPAERLAFALAPATAPLARFFLLLLVQGVFWALVAVAVLSGAREVVAVVRAVVGARRTVADAA